MLPHQYFAYTVEIRALSFQLVQNDQGFDLFHGEAIILSHSAKHPAFSIGRGKAKMAMSRGNFDISDKVSGRNTLRSYAILRSSPHETEIELSSDSGAATAMIVHWKTKGDQASLSVRCADPKYNRIWIQMVAVRGEHFWGGGEQMSYLRLNGRRFPMWTSEPGVGRDKSSELTQKMDEDGNAGGDYWTTNYPQPTWLSSRHYAGHIDGLAYSVLDFSKPGHLTLEYWDDAFTVELFGADNLRHLVGRLSERFGQQPVLPDWAISGAIVGLKDGENSFIRLEKIAASGAAITGMWCEDWVGIRQTSFGKRLMWDWRWKAERYADLPKRIAKLAKSGIRFLGYVNPYLAVDGSLYKEAAAQGLLALRQDSDAIYAVDFGEFDAAIVDFTNPAACAWFAERVIGQEMIDFGLSGWMADFGEYLPIDVRLFDGSDPVKAHNHWPVAWAKVNADAIAARRRNHDTTFFMRAGFSGIQAYCPLLWAGDQCVDFSRHDGIGTVITAALSAGLVGNAYHHSDLGGYTSLHGLVRTAELMHRWIDLAAFTPVMRSHEGNRPADNLQIDSSPEILSHFARMSQVHARLAPYVHFMMAEAAKTGLPLQRPLFLHYEDPQLMALQDQYLYGADMMVAPVTQSGVTGRNCVLPDDDWVHLWSGEAKAGGVHFCDAPSGQPPVFYLANSKFAPLFRQIAEEFIV